MQTAQKIKRTAKTTLQLFVPSQHPPIVVASMGRSGSTLVYNALCDAVAKDRFANNPGIGRRIVRDSAWRLGDRKLHRGVVYKTHAMASELPADAEARVLFLFRRPSDVALSVLSCSERYGSSWIASHLEHLAANGPLEDLATADILRMEEQVDSWLARTAELVLGLRFESLWENVDVLEDFVQLPVILPPRAPAESVTGKVSRDTVRSLREAYAHLDQKVKTIPDVVVEPPFDLSPDKAAKSPR